MKEENLLLEIDEEWIRFEYFVYMMEEFDEQQDSVIPSIPHEEEILDCYEYIIGRRLFYIKMEEGWKMIKGYDK